MARHKFVKPSLTKKPKNMSIYLPEEIITQEILTRLPVKPLLRFRCVSKSWLSSLTSPTFIKSHLKMSSNSPNSVTLLSIYHYPFSVEQFSTTSLKATSIDFPSEILRSGFDLRIVGSCNGLLCISVNSNGLFIWNPCTGICKKLPPVNVEMRQDMLKIFGFGYNESNDDYKVICFIIKPVGDFSLQAFIYSFRTNSWKIFGRGFNDFCPISDGSFFIGKVHCLARRIRESGRFELGYDIVSSDLENEVCEIFKLPNYREGVARINLEVLKGNLCVLQSYETCADLWVMNEYGVEESWTKILSIPYFEFEDGRNLLYKTPLVMLPSGEILLVYDHQFVVYNPIDMTMWVPGSGSKETWKFMEAGAFVESLVSPFEDETIGIRDQ